MGLGRITLALLAAPLLIGADSVDPLFKPCHGGMRVTCVVDGDTLWLAGDKIRLADINTPEVTRPGCPAERALGEAATRRLVALLNRGPVAFERAVGERDVDRYGRKLRIARRDGRSLGGTLVSEGLAEPWTGRRRDWCGVQS